jgi:hypothetical protein
MYDRFTGILCCEIEIEVKSCEYLLSSPPSIIKYQGICIREWYYNKLIKQMQPCLNSPKFPVLYILFVHLIFIYSIFVPHWASTVIGYFPKKVLYSCCVKYIKHEPITVDAQCGTNIEYMKIKCTKRIYSRGNLGEFKHGWYLLLLR